MLNVHAAYRAAPATLLDAFATLAIEGGIGSRESERASQALSEWPELVVAISRAREAHRSRIGIDSEDEPTHCCATAEQRAYLRALYRYFNLTRFEAFLPDDVPVRLSSRMKSALGHMLSCGDATTGRVVVEIALNVDLMLPGNGAERIDTLLHEMAHAADYLESGERGHGPSWRRWARRVGCRATTIYDRPVRFRHRRRQRITRVPPLPAALRYLSD